MTDAANRHNLFRLGGALLALSLLGMPAARSAAASSAPAKAAPAPDAGGQDLAYEDRIAELERTVQTLATELQRTREDLAIPEDSELESAYGLGPAASKIYGALPGLSIGGYGEALYRNYVEDDNGGQRDISDFLRMVLYFGYKFRENIVFNAEVEIEHANEIWLEFATLDYLWRDEANFRAGLMLLPVGFLNELHEPTFYYGISRPDVENLIIPTTWRENGAGVFGTIAEQLHYKLYVVNSFNGAKFSPSGFRDGRQKGSKAMSEHLAVSGRLDWEPFEGGLIGGSFYTGSVGQNQVLEDIDLPDTNLTLFDLHAQLHWRNLWLRGLYAHAFVEDAGDLTSALHDVYAAGGGKQGLKASQAIAEELRGFYGEIAYDVAPLVGILDKSIEPFYRYESYDTQYQMPSVYEGLEDESKEIVSHTFGVSYKPIPNLVFKADYRFRSAEVGTIADEFNLGFGYIF